MSQKSDEETPPEITPEQQYISFIKDRLEKHGILNLQNLTGHLSSLPSRVRNKFGTSKNCLKRFIKEHPESFKLDRKENVDIATPAEKYNRLDSISSDDCISMQTLIDAAAAMDVKPKETTMDVCGEIPHPRDDLPYELKEIKGKIYRLFQVYGFITVKNSRLQSSVYFDLQSFENGKIESFTDSTLKLGEGVFLNARKGPDNCEAQYRASLVWRPESSEYFQIFTNGTHDSDAKEIRGCGKIHNLFPKYGFISRNTSVRDNVFFHLNNVVIPNEKEVNSLLDVFKIGNLVKFHAIPSEQKDSAIKWQATHVWLDNVNDTASKDGNDIFISDSESYDSASDRNDTEEKSPELDGKSLVPKRPQLGINSISQISSSVSSLSPVALPFYATSILPNQINGDVLKSVSNQIGILAAKTKDTAIIIFGERYMHRSLTTLDEMFINGETINDFLLELGENSRVQFDAVYQANGPYDCNWKTTLAWMGKKPDNPRKKPLPNHVELLSSSSSLIATDWASIVEYEQRQERCNSESSEISSSAPSCISKNLSRIQNDVTNLVDSPTNQNYDMKEQSKTPSSNSMLSQDSTASCLQPNPLNNFRQPSSLASPLIIPSNESDSTSRITSQTFPLGMFSMSSAPPGCGSSYSPYQQKPLFQPRTYNTQLSTPYLHTGHGLISNSILHQSTSSSEPPGMMSTFSPLGGSSINPQTNALEQKILELTLQIDYLRKQQEVSNFSSHDRNIPTKAICYKEAATQTINYPSDDKKTSIAKVTSTKPVQTYSTGKVMFSELYLDS